MALYDNTTQKIVVRIAYDGPAEAGKTTNLEQLCTLFTTQRRSEMATPETHDGRTMYFDWLQLDGGLVGGHGLRSHLVTVPGQPELRQRRQYLVDSADVVVFVCESTDTGLTEARPMFEFLCDRLSARGQSAARIVVQANKQDVQDALGIAAVRARLGVDDKIPIVLATATGGVGVRESVTLAIRAAATLATRQLRDQGVDALEGIPQTTSELHAAIRAVEELTAAAGATSGASLPSQANSASPDLPSPFVPLDCIWPRLLGRQILHRMVHSRDGLTIKPACKTHSGHFSVALPLWTVSTNQSLRFEDEQTARAALADAAARLSKLGNYLHHRTVLCLQPTVDGSLWLWTLVPTSVTLNDRLLQAEAEGDDAHMAIFISKLIRAVTDSVVLALQEGIFLDMQAHNFGSEDDMMVYVSERLERLESPRQVVDALLHIADYVEKRQPGRSAVLEQLALSLDSALGHDSGARVRLGAALEDARPRTAPGECLQKLLLNQLKSTSARPALATQRESTH